MSPYIAVNVIPGSDVKIFADLFDQFGYLLPATHRLLQKAGVPCLEGYSVFVVEHTDMEGKLVGTVNVETNGRTINPGWFDLRRYSLHACRRERRYN